MSAPRVRPLADLLALFAPPAVWFLHFTAVYGAEALLCRAPAAGAESLMRWTGAAATLAALAALVAFAALPAEAEAAGHTGAAFRRGAARLLALLSALAVLWTALPLALLPACAPPQ